MQFGTLINAVRIIQAGDKHWIPVEYRGVTFFGAYDIWEYFELGDPDSECQWCKAYANQVFSGNQLRSVFPDLKIEGPDDIYPNVHMTLWGKETCKCQLIRVNQELINDPEKLVMYTGSKTPKWSPEGYVTDNVHSGECNCGKK